MIIYFTTRQVKNHPKVLLLYLMETAGNEYDEKTGSVTLAHKSHPDVSSESTAGGMFAA